MGVLTATSAFSADAGMAAEATPEAASPPPDVTDLFESGAGKLLDKHPNLILSIAIATLMQSLLIAALLIHSRRRQAAEERLRISEERYRTVIESQREMVCRYREDTTLTFVNDAYCRYFGKSREDLLGKKFLSFIPVSGRDTILQAVRTMTETKRPISQEHQVILSDGKIAWMTWDDYPIFNDAGKIDEFQCLGRDISVQRQAVEELRQSEERFSGVFHGSPTAISIIRQADGRLLDVNPSWEKMYEISREQALGRTPVELGMFDTRAAKKRFKSFLISAKPLLGFEQSTRTPTGGRRWMNISTQLVLLGGEPCFIVMSKNITDQFEAEETRKSLARATRVALLGEFVASIAHEINQPLGAILSNAETAEILLQLREPSISEVRQILEDIRRDDLRASETINRVRSLITQGECRMVPLDINEVLRGVVKLIAHDVRRRGVSVVTQITPDLPLAAGDRVQIEQILLNLMLNAMDASAGTPMTRRTLTLSTVLKSDGWVEISVADNGHGIPPEMLPRIFESFYSSKSNGMGLGLSLARSISEAHGGSITAENNSPCGATFRLVLPVHTEKPDL
ncbi:PAS domain S-box protein [Luteolibacter yonseiensis]|uniref:histidine kinase n=1 Tax=Luteolibacter yonseiensis TaxID=1144680 RepID=A0A934R287_9BACT|nr:PAS domain-containing sensor histidine kinase [Luteolibacter yonseiensis]MBK1814185.1 PAS domain S-box protein [Luteolibacter yonseiensis]